MQFTFLKIILYTLGCLNWSEFYEFKHWAKGVPVQMMREWENTLRQIWGMCSQILGYCSTFSGMITTRECKYFCYEWFWSKGGTGGLRNNHCANIVLIYVANFFFDYTSLFLFQFYRDVSKSLFFMLQNYIINWETTLSILSRAISRPTYIFLLSRLHLIRLS